MMDSDRTKISFDVTKGNVEIEGSEQFVRENLEYFRNLTDTVVEAQKYIPSQRSGESESLGEERSGEKPQSDETLQELGSEGLTSFLRDHPHLKNEMELVTAFTYYLSEKLSKGKVTYKDIEECYRLAGKPVPQIRNSVNNASHRRKWLQRDDSGSIKVTRVGRNHIEHSPKKNRDKSRNEHPNSHSALKKSRRSSSSPKLPKVKGDLDLYGSSERTSFKDFANLIDPKDNVNRIAVSAYYLTTILEMQSFDENDVYTCFDHMEWKPPLYLRNNIINHKNMYGYYVEGDGRRFRITLRLKNYIEHDLKSDS